MGQAVISPERGTEVGVSTPITSEVKLVQPSDLQDIRRALASREGAEPVAKDVVAHLSKYLDSSATQELEKLVQSGRLDKETLRSLSNFSDAIAKGSLPSGLTAEQGKEFLNSIIKEAADPNKLNQGRHAFCAVVSPLWNVARTNPSEFLRIGVGLANEGKVSLAGGAEVSINRTALDDTSLVRKNDGKFDTLSMSERVVMSALTDFANGAQSYDFKNDKSNGQYSGLYADEYLKLVSQLYGKEYKLDSNKASFETSLTAPAGIGTMVDMKWNSKGDHVNHMVTFAGFDAEGNVLIRNPWGKQKSSVADEDGPATRRLRPELGEGMESISRAEFFSRINGVVIPGKMTEPVIRDVPTTEPSTAVPLSAAPVEPQKGPNHTESTEARVVMNSIRESYEAIAQRSQGKSSIPARDEHRDDDSRAEEEHLRSRRNNMPRRRDEDGLEVG